MTFRKITNDNSVSYIPKTEQTTESQPKTMKAGSLLRKQSKNVSQNNKKFLKIFSAQEIKYLK